MKPSAIVTKAIDLIEERGWERHQYQSKDGRLCLVAALRLAAGEELRDAGQDQPVVPDGPNYADYLATYWELSSRVPTGHLVGWNDQHARDKEEVIEFLHNAATSLNEQGK